MRRRASAAAFRAARPVFAFCLAAGLALSGCAAVVGGGGPTRPIPGDLPSASRADLVFGGNPEALIGREAGEIQRALGSPQLVRRDAPAQVWQYRSDACVLDLFLYQEARQLRVAYLETRDQEARMVPAQACFASVLAVQRGLPSS